MAAAGGVWAKGAFLPGKFLQYVGLSHGDAKNPYLKIDKVQARLDRWKDKQALIASGVAIEAARAFEAGIVNDKIETAAVFSLDGSKRFDKQGGKSYVNFSNAEISNMRGGVLTHNHPSGRSFSVEDVMMGRQAGLAAVRAVGTNVLGEQYEYEIRPAHPVSGGSYGWPALVTVKQVSGQVDAEVRSQFWPQINEGKISIDFANAHHSHQVWTMAAPQLGLVYTRRRVN